MNYYDLQKAAKSAIESIDEFSQVYGGNNVLASIKAQMSFVYTHALNLENPTEHLNQNPFTYSVLASREFASPEELAIKEKLDKVSYILDRG